MPSVFARRYSVIFVIAATLPMASTVRAAQTDITRPMGSNAFGSTVTVLANSNIVVTDPNYALDN